MTDEELNEFMDIPLPNELSMHELACLNECFDRGMISADAYNLVYIRHQEATRKASLEDMSMGELARVMKGLKR